LQLPPEHVDLALLRRIERLELSDEVVLPLML
jgi:hypothetical protein